MDGRSMAGGWAMDGRWMVDGWSVGGRWVVDGWSMGGRWMVDGWSMGGRWVVDGWSIVCTAEADVRCRVTAGSGFTPCGGRFGTGWHAEGSLGARACGSMRWRVGKHWWGTASAGEMHLGDGSAGCVHVGGPAAGGGRGARDAGGRVEPEGGVGSGRGAVGCVGEAARQGAIVLHLFAAVNPFVLDGWDACGGDGRARVCDDGRGHVRDGVGHAVGVEGHVGKVVQEVLASVQNELCTLQAVAEARAWWYAMRVTCVMRVCDARDARSSVVASRHAAGERGRTLTCIASVHSTRFPHCM